MKKILVVDDDPNISELLEIRLRQNDYDVVKASDGIEALEMAKTQHPDLIMLDVAMPLMDGYQLVRELRWQDELRHIPILVLTAQNQTRKMFDAVEVGYFVTKPFDSELLLGLVADCVKNHSWEDQ